MKDFGNPTSSPKTIDGKKSFRGVKVSGRELDHKAFIVVDYEKNVIHHIEEERYKKEVNEILARGGDTSLVKKPRPKYLVSIIYQNQLRKLWTGDKENWDELDNRKADGDIPFFASMIADYSGPYPKYTFSSATALGYTLPSDEEVRNLYVQLNIPINE